MAKRQKKRGLGYQSIQRFTVIGCENRGKYRGKHVYTSVVDAMVVAKRCSRATSKRIDVLYGLPGNEGRIASCTERKCKTPDGKAVPMRKLYEAEQRGGATMAAFDEQRRKSKGSSGKVPAKAKKTKAKKKKMAPWKSGLISRVAARAQARKG